VFVEAMQEGAVTLSDSGLILYCNYRFANMVNMPLEKVLGASIDLFLVHESRRTFFSLLSRSRFGSNRAEIILSASDGTSLPVSVALSPLTLDSMTAVCVVFTDLTLQKQREQEILLLQKELELRVIERTAELSRANLQLQAEIEQRIRVAEQLVTLQTVTTAFSASLSMQDVADVLIGEGLGAVGAVSGAVFVLSDDNQLLKLIKSAGYSDELIRLFYRLPIYSAPQLLRECLQTQRPIWYQPSSAFTNDLPFDVPFECAAVQQSRDGKVQRRQTACPGAIGIAADILRFLGRPREDAGLDGGGGRRRPCLAKNR
jgi:PAS domain S-box-containing protein